MKQIIGCFKTQDGILLAALVFMLGGSALSLLHAFAGNAGPAMLFSPIVFTTL